MRPELKKYLSDLILKIFRIVSIIILLVFVAMIVFTILYDNGKYLNSPPEIHFPPLWLW